MLMKTHVACLRLVKALSLLAVLMFVGGAGSASAQDCSSTTDAQLVTTILDEIKKDSVLAPQMSHIVVGSVNRFVKLQGWTDTKGNYDRLVSKTACVVAINVNRFEETPPPADSPLRPQRGGCGPGTKPCGDVCIPEADACSDKSKSASE
jgi:hypothetical protein